MKRARSVTLVLGILTGIGLLSTGCSSPSRAEAFTPAKVGPIGRVEGWFQAINEKNLKRTLDQVEPNKKGMMDWGDRDTTQWPTFSALHCRMTDQKVDFSEVYCSFMQSPVPTAGNPVTFWTVAMRRRTSGPWLISNYGQG